MVFETHERHVSDEDRRDFLKALGITAGAAVGGTAIEELTLGDLEETVTVESSGALAERGKAIRSDLTGQLDAELVATEMAGVAGAIDQLSDVRSAGVPEMDQTLYSELTAAGWAVDEHLVETGFYESAETNLPAFSADHIEATTKQLIESDAIAPVLSEVGFDDQSQFDIVANVVTQVDHLEMWQPTWMLEHDAVEGIEADHVAPLHRRAAAGALNWVGGLDHFLAQREVLITDAILDAAAKDVQTMLGGLYLLSAAAEALARGEISDAELTALITGSSGVLITGQTDLQNDVVRISDEMRAPRTEV